ncbi:glycerophosphodiester phosphodiesterase [Bacillaceae bacterium S4-13-58]
MKTIIFAHRGASKEAPENTMPAFELGYEQGAQGIETDVQLTKDRVPVLIHDEKINRTSNYKGYVKDFTYQELSQLDFGSWHSSKYKGASIITLDSFLEWAQHKSLLINIELKTNVLEYEGIEEIVLDRINHYDMFNRTVCSSFNPNTIKRLHHLDPRLEIALLTKQKLKNLDSTLHKIGSRAFHTKYRNLSESLVKACKSHKIPLRIYTVNNPAHMIRCFHLGVTGIFTDLPALALEYKKIVEETNHS